ncbi:hypothetical protein SAMN04487832_104167 [Ruminococcus sp. XPD3002]|nr:hypothetical protein SAMN04487832_104167 [Ruminococcus flavefaciens]
MCSPRSFSEPLLYIFSLTGYSLIVILNKLFLHEYPVRLKICGKKSLEKGFGGDSPQCGEMSEGQRGPPPSEGTFPQKGSSPDNSNSSEMLFHTLSEVVIDLLLDNLSFLMCRSLGSYVSLYLRLCT